jgi:hypothetical protein
MAAYFLTQVYHMLKTRNNNQGLPEFRLPMLGSCAVLVPPGLLIYGVRDPPNVLPTSQRLVSIAKYVF